MRLTSRSLLRDMRKAAGLTQSEVADRLQIDRSYYSRMERGERPVDVDLADAVADMCGFRTQVIGADHDHALQALAELKAADLLLIERLARLLPDLHPVRRLDLELQLESWERSFQSTAAGAVERNVKKM